VCPECGAFINAGYVVCPYCECRIVQETDAERRERLVVDSIVVGACTDHQLAGNSEQQVLLRKRDTAAARRGFQCYLYEVRKNPALCAALGDSQSLPPWFAKACQHLWRNATEAWRLQAAETYRKYSAEARAKGQPPTPRPAVLDTGNFKFDPVSVRGKALDNAILEQTRREAARAKRAAEDAPPDEPNPKAPRLDREGTKGGKSKGKGKGKEEGKGRRSERGKGKGKTPGKG